MKTSTHLLLGKKSYKIFKPFEYSEMLFYGTFFGNYSDISKKYIGMCQNHQQLKQIIGKKYPFQPIIICKVDNHKLTKLVFEKNKDGEYFPHLFEPLHIQYIVNTLHLDTNVNDNTQYMKIIDDLQWHI